MPKGDHDKILKEHFFYGIKSVICNSICHPYNNDTVTFFQPLVKAHQNEEVDTISKLLNKGATTNFTSHDR